MSDLNTTLSRLHEPLNRGWLRVLLFVLGVFHVSYFMWDPVAYDAQIGGFTSWMGVSFIWAICSSMVFGVGFRPIHWCWQLFFSPYLALSILALFTIMLGL